MTDAKKPVEYFNLRDLTPERMEEMFGPPGEFKPHWYYNKAGDQIEAFWSNAPAHGEYLNDDIDIYRDMKTNEVVGVDVKNLLLRLEKEGVACSTSKLAAIRDKVKEMLAEWRKVECMYTGIELSLRGEFCNDLISLRKLLEELIGDKHEETGKD